MPDVRKILVPVDFSPPSRAALSLAADFAQAFDAAIEVLHVRPAPTWLSPEALLVSAASLDDSLQSRAGAELDALVAELASRGLTVTGRLDAGPIAETIVRCAGAGFDLVVLGTAGRAGLAHFFLGSVAERVLRLCAVPVITTRAPSLAPQAHALVVEVQP